MERLFDLIELNTALLSGIEEPEKTELGIFKLLTEIVALPLKQPEMDL